MVMVAWLVGGVTMLQSKSNNAFGFWFAFCVCVAQQRFLRLAVVLWVTGCDRLRPSLFWTDPWREQYLAGTLFGGNTSVVTRHRQST